MDSHTHTKTNVLLFYLFLFSKTKKFQLATWVKQVAKYICLNNFYQAKKGGKRNEDNIDSKVCTDQFWKFTSRNIQWSKHTYTVNHIYTSITCWIQFRTTRNHVCIRYHSFKAASSLRILSFDFMWLMGYNVIT